MKYVYDYAIMSSVFLAIIVVMFFSKRQFPNRRNRIFAVILVCAIIDILLDIASSLIIEYCPVIPVWVTYTVNTVFYVLQVVFPALMFVYIRVESKVFVQKLIPTIIFLFPAAVMVMLFLTNPFNHFMFYVSQTGEYIQAEGFTLAYAETAFYLLCSAICLIKFKKNIAAKEYYTTLVSLLIIAASIVGQMLVRRIMLTSAGMTVAITMMYLIMQKPEDMLDGMTNAFSREAMFTLISDLCETNKPYAMMTVELHNLRRINRIFGMSFGNDLIKEMSHSISAAAEGGWIFRFLGNVFVVITLDEKTDENTFVNIKDALDKPCVVQGVEMKLYTTVCRIESTAEVKNEDDACNMIETVISEAKRGCLNVINVNMMRDMKRRSKVETELMKAISTESFEVYYQPIYSIKSKCFDTVEALVRFSPAGMGSISPAEFIPIAEKQGVVAEIDSIVLKKVCTFIKECDPVTKLGIKYFQLNLSPAEFINNDLSQRVIDTVKEYGIDPSHLLFEITETTAVSEFDSLHSNIENMRSFGLGFVLDDYGTGYSNISMLMRLPFSTVKFDRSMLTSAEDNHQNSIIFEKTISMFLQLGITTVVEGVETAEEGEYARLCGADRIQGYYYALPMVKDDLIHFMKKESFML